MLDNTPILSIITLNMNGLNKKKIERDCQNGLKNKAWDFPSGPVAKTLWFQTGGLGSIPGQGTRSHKLQLLGQPNKQNK